MANVKNLYNCNVFHYTWNFSLSKAFPILKLETFEVIKETPCGYWFKPITGGVPRWCTKYAKKRLAYPTKEEALESFIRRKTIRKQYIERELEEINYLLEQADDLKVKIKEIE